MHWTRAAVLVAVAALPLRAAAQKGSIKQTSGGQRHLSIVQVAALSFPSISVGQSIGGALNSSDFTRDDDTYADGFDYNARAGEVITITMRSSDFDAWLVVDDPNGPMHEHNDDGAGGTDAQLTVTFPHAGRFIILANTVSPGSSGSYTLSVASGGSTGSTASTASSNGGASIVDIARMSLPMITMGQTIGGSLTTSDIRRDDDTYTDAFFYDGRAGEQITVTMRSGDFDAWVVIDDPNGPMHEHDDDGAGGTDSRLTVTLPHDGRYIILANVVQKQRTGSYTLTLSR